MLRLFTTLCAAAALAVFSGGALAQDNRTGDNRGDRDNQAGQQERGQITHANAGDGTLTLKVKGPDGRETEKTFHLARDVKFYDADGQPARITAFHAGDQVLLMAQKGQATEVRPDKLERAEVTNVNPAEGTITVKMKDKEGREVEKTFHLTGAVRYFDSTGLAAKVNVFHAGDQVLVMAENGRLSELRQDRPADEKK